MPLGYRPASARLDTEKWERDINDNAGRDCGGNVPLTVGPATKQQQCFMFDLYRKSNVAESR